MSSTAIDQARRIVLEAEQSLKSLISRMMESGDYEALPSVARIAGELHRINIDREPNPGSPAIPPLRPGGPPGRPAHPYPDFSRNAAGDKLRMIGWSRKHGGEYKHEAPKAVLKILVDTLIECGAQEEPVSTDDILPNIVHPETGREYPEYHSRTLMRWLREIGVVKREGHKGYYFAAEIGGDPWPTIDAHWDRLPTRD